MVLFRDFYAIENGAKFLNVDLHIHSFGASHDVKDSTMTPDAIVDSAVKQKLSVIAITDHNSDANVQRAIDYAKEKYQGQILVLPGVEVTTAHGHLLVYFAPDCTANLSKFLSRIDLIGEMGAENTRTAKSMADAIAEAERLGGICIAAHIDREKTGFDAFAAGFQNWKKDIIVSPGLYGLECDSKDVLKWFSEYDEAGSAGAERKRMLEARKNAPGLSARYHLAHVQGSDAHAMQQLEHQTPCKSWTRIKLAELSFNAFRVAMIDPSARVRACASVPRSIPRIRAMAVTGGFLNEEKIHFSGNLNCLIGGRGTGKSTAIRTIAYAFNLINDDYATSGCCPDSVTVFCENENGVLYRYVRTRDGDIEVMAKEDGSVSDVPVDAFHIEYFGQGELAKVAEDPLKQPELFQAFLDRHTNLRDLLETEESLVAQLRENAGRLNPLESAFGQLSAKKQNLEDIEKKLKIAEEGNLREIVALQSRLASEKTIRETVEAIAADYDRGYSFSSMQRDFDQIVLTVGACTEDGASVKALAGIKACIQGNNTIIKQKEQELASLLKGCAKELMKYAGELKTNHQRMSGEIAIKLADLKARGIATNISGLESLLRQKVTVAKDIASIEQRADERKQCQEQRSRLLRELKDVREQMTTRRKEQLRGINSNLGVTITDYTVFVRYDDAGITAEFELFIQEKMHGTHLQDNLIQQICNNITPSQLADLVLENNSVKLAEVSEISVDWAKKIIDKLRYWYIIFELQVLGKQPKPIITVRTKSIPVRDIPVLQLSDGQRHTILLTIAMLAESNIPLIIDQPEDDLDNAFIFTTIVKTLRSIKEKRQVILVTHNANIAVLGDAELLLPMCRENDCGKIKERGSIDREATRRSVVDILEGGQDAFLRRKEMYSH